VRDRVQATVAAVAAAVLGAGPHVLHRVGPLAGAAFFGGNLLVGLTYACIGALAGAAVGRLGATYLVLFLAMLGTGILQNPMFGDGTPGGLAYAFPDHGANRIVIDGAFSQSFHAWGELALAVGWLAVLGLAVAWVLHRLLGGAR
jgi:hypothetical protein